MASNEDDHAMDYFTFELDKLFVIPLYFLSFASGIPLNGYIIHRLYVRGVKGSHYYKLLMLMSVIDIYIAFFYAVEYYNAGGWIIGIATIIVFFATSFVCVYSILVVLLAETDTYSVQTLKAYKRMAVAHFVQCILVEIDIIAQNFTLGFLFIVVSATALFYTDQGDTSYERIPGWMHTLLKVNVVFMTLFYLIPVLKPFVRSAFIAWALRRLLSEEKKVVIRVKPTSTIRSTTKDN